MTISEGKTETEAAAELAAEPLVLDAKPIIGGEGRPDRVAVALPPGWRTETIDLERFLDAPRRSRGTISVHDADSFIAAVARRAGEHSTTIYADTTERTLVAVLNDDTAEVEPGWRDYRIALLLRRTTEWTHWRARDGVLVDQETFAEHIEDGLLEIQDPPAAEVLEIAQTFHATTSAAFKQGTRLQSGATQFVYEEEVSAKAGPKGTLEVPERIVLVVAPFYGSARYEVPARFRYRLARGAFNVGYKLERPDEVERAAFADVVTGAKAGLEGFLFVNGPAPSGEASAPDRSGASA